MNRALVQAMARASVPHEQAAQVLLNLYGNAKPVNIEQFEPLVKGEYVIQAERFRQVLDELHPLHVDHWHETEKYRAGIPLNPDYEAMADRERWGQLLQITARRDGVLVGHVRMYIHRSLHTQTLFGEEDTLYLDPVHRGGFVALALMRYAERCLLALGIREIRANSKVSNNADVLMRRLGYPQVAIQFVKVFPADGVQEAALPKEDAAHELSP